MSSPAARSEATSRIFVLADSSHAVFEVFELLDISDGIVRVRSPFLFEIGEELAVRVERGTSHSADGPMVFEAQVRVRAHVGPPEARITELEILQRSAPRGTVTG